MSNIILDYTDYYEDKYEYSKNGSGDNIVEKQYNIPNDISSLRKEVIVHFVVRIYLLFMKI